MVRFYYLFRTPHRLFFSVYKSLPSSLLHSPSLSPHSYSHCIKMLWTSSHGSGSLLPASQKIRIERNKIKTKVQDMAWHVSACLLSPSKIFYCNTKTGAVP